MTDERKIKAALKVDGSQIHLPSDLLERINRLADDVAPVRPSLWSRWRLGPKLELAAACLLLVGLLGVAAVRNLNHNPTPAGGEQGSGTQGIASRLPSASDVTKAYFSGYPGAEEKNLDQSVITKVLGWLKDAPVVGLDKEFSQRQRDFILVMELRNGERVRVRLAEDCVVTKAADGTGTTCRNAEGQVNLITSSGEGPRLRAPDMADWLKGQAAHVGR
jgi:hypothetical protein